MAVTRHDRVLARAAAIGQSVRGRRRTLGRSHVSPMAKRRSPGRGRRPTRGLRRGAPPAVPVARARASPALALGDAASAFLVYPTFPNYDSYYSLLWGREVLDGELPSFDAYRAPTQHPLAIAFGALLSLARRRRRPRSWSARRSSRSSSSSPALYRLGARVVHVARRPRRRRRCCARASTSRSSPRAATSTSRTWRSSSGRRRSRPARRGAARRCSVLLAARRPAAPGGVAAERPVLPVAASWPATWGQRVRYARCSTAIGPVVWTLTDFVVTGDPLFSLTHTSGLAEELGRQRGLSEIPSATVELPRRPRQAARLLRRRARARAAPSCSCRGASACRWRCSSSAWATFVLVGLAGLSVIDRYLLVPSLMVMVFAAVTLAGWTMLRDGPLARTAVGDRRRRSSSPTASSSPPRASTSSTFDTELRFRGDSHAVARGAAARPARRRPGARCGPVSVPNHKLVPDVALDPRRGRATTCIARSDESPARAPAQRRGAIYATEPRSRSCARRFTPQETSVEDVR